MTVNNVDYGQLVEALQAKHGFKLKSPARILAGFYQRAREAWEHEYATDSETPYQNRAPHGEDGWQNFVPVPERMSKTQRDSALAVLVSSGIVEREQRIEDETVYDFNAPAKPGERPTKKVPRTFTYYRLAPRHRESKVAWLSSYRILEESTIQRIEGQRNDYRNTQLRLKRLVNDGELVLTLSGADLVGFEPDDDEARNVLCKRLRNYSGHLQNDQAELRSSASAIRILRNNLASIRALIIRLEGELADLTNTIEGEAVEAPKELNQ